MYKDDLALNTLQWLICHLPKPNKTFVYFKQNSLFSVERKSKCPRRTSSKL